MRVLTRLSVLACSVLAAQLVHCGSEDEGQAAAGLCEGDLPPIIYDGDASDEAIERVWDKRCEARAVTGAATLTAPGDGETVAPGTAPELRWEQSLALAPVRGAPARAGAPGRGGPVLRFGIPAAWAHLPPVTGWVYLVEMKLGSESLWLFTTERSWTPDPIAWQRIAAAGEVTVSITSTYLNQNVIEEGPWLGETRTFHVEAE